MEYLRKENPLRDASGRILGHYTTLDETALFDVQIKRLHEYKRQLMNILHTLMVYHELKANPQARRIKRLVLFGGKAAPGYVIAKETIQLIAAVARTINADPAVNGALHVVFMENYNVSKAELMIPAADLSQQISMAGMEASGTSNMKLALNGALTLGTEDGANIEMHRAVTDAWWPFSFGNPAEENERLLKSKAYDPGEIYRQNPSIHRAVDCLQNRALAQSDEEHAAFTHLYRSLLDTSNGNQPDRFFVLGDLMSYYTTQLKVEALFQKPEKWAETALRNIASMGHFSSDTSIHNYAQQIWDLKPCPCDPEEHDRVRTEYSEHDKCRIL